MQSLKTLIKLVLIFNDFKALEELIAWQLSKFLNSCLFVGLCVFKITHRCTFSAIKREQKIILYESLDEINYFELDFLNSINIGLHKFLTNLIWIPLSFWKSMFKIDTLYFNIKMFSIGEYILGYKEYGNRYLLTPLHNSYRSHQAARNNAWNWKKLKFVKTQKWSKLKILTSWDRKSVQPHPIFGRQNPSNPRLWHTVRVTSELIMDPTNVIAWDPQVWLLALIWCKICIFRYFVIYC